MRGKQNPGEVEKSYRRLIPACAGKTRFLLSRLEHDWAHPRVCGENLASTSQRSPAAGSSPRVRGKLRQLRHRLRDRGLIPACAGKTETSTARPAPAWAHPRVCGENEAIKASDATDKGSSPRVRGKLTSRCRRLGVTGLIPACAGKTERIRAEFRIGGAHPRVCGENCPDGRAHGLLQGSSPRVRGKH